MMSNSDNFLPSGSRIPGSNNGSHAGHGRKSKPIPPKDPYNYRNQYQDHYDAPIPTSDDNEDIK